MSDCNHEYESIVAQAHLDMCLHCGQPEVNHTIATLRARNEELEAKIERMSARGIEQLLFDNEELRAELAPLEGRSAVDHMKYQGELETKVVNLTKERDALREAVGEPMNPCGECHLKPGETCDVCGAVDPRSQIDYGLKESSDE